MSAGPKAKVPVQDPLNRKVRSGPVVLEAWHAIRRNAETSRTKSTREAARTFGAALPRELRRIQSGLLKGYQFSPAHGAALSKGKGKAGKRPLVIASLADRVVQRAILDVLQGATELTNIQQVLATPTSFGGIKGKGVDDAIRLFDAQVAKGHRFVAGSDISGFFTRVRPSAVLALLASDTGEQGFIELVGRAMTVELANADKMSPDDRALFPNGDDGVAQGCPLSALAGNVSLADFDREMNNPARGVTCIRYIDDFIITGPTERAVTKAMESAATKLQALGMAIYDPATSQTKAFSGPIGARHVFLGYELVPCEYAPSEGARRKLLERIDTLLRDGRKAMDKAVSGKLLTGNDQCFVQTLGTVDKVINGWRKSFKASNSPLVLESLDRQIDARLLEFEKSFHSKVKGRSKAARRRALGVRSLET